MKQLFILMTAVFFSGFSFAAENPQPQAPSTDKVLIFVMPGKTPTTTNLDTGEVTIITTKVKTDNNDNN